MAAVALVAVAVATTAGCGDGGEAAQAERTAEARKSVTSADCLALLQDVYKDPANPPEETSEKERTCRQAGYDPVWEEKGPMAADEDYFAAFSKGGAVPPSNAPSPTVTPPPTESGAGGVMPNVVCMNLQDAQDKIQENGVFFSRSFDATGDGRNQIIDSNWIVVSQDPPAGSPIREGEANLGAVKIGEPSPC